MKIVYVEYDLPGPNRMPWSAHPDKDGTFWIPYYGRANKIGHLDPVTGEVREYPVPNLGTAAIHSAVPAADGSVWLTEQGSNKLGRWTPSPARSPNTRTTCASTRCGSIPGPATYGPLAR
jgi:streptogramin lyase